jgi:hypothetical protein
VFAPHSTHNNSPWKNGASVCVLLMAQAQRSAAALVDCRALQRVWMCLGGWLGVFGSGLLSYPSSSSRWGATVLCCGWPLAACPPIDQVLSSLQDVF